MNAGAQIGLERAERNNERIPEGVNTRNSQQHQKDNVDHVEQVAAEAAVNPVGIAFEERHQ